MVKPMLPVLTLAAAGLAMAQGVPQVRNGAMEGPPQDHSDGQGLLVTPAGWTPVNVEPSRGDRLSVQPSDRPGAGQCLHVRTFGHDAGVYQTITLLEQGVTYLVSGWVKRLSGTLVIEAYPHAWGQAVMRRVDGESQGWRRVTVPLTPLDAGAHLYLVTSREGDFLIDDVELRPAPVRVGDPALQPYDLTEAWRYRVALSLAPTADGQPAPGARDVLVRAVAEGGPASALGPEQRATLYPGATAEVELRLPFAEKDGTFAVEVTDAATGEVLGGSALARQLRDPLDVRFPYKNALFHTTGLRWPLRIHVHRTPRAVASRLRATAILRDGEDRVVRRLASAFAKDGLRLPLDASDLPCGTYELTVVLNDQEGRMRTSARTRPLRILPPARHEVALTPNGEVLVDGEAFFPIGLYWVFGDPKDFRPGPARKTAEFIELRQAGFNTLHSYAFEHNDANDTDENALAYLDTAQELGFKVMMGLRRDWYQGETLDLAAIERRVLALKDHPALLCWTLWDEPNFDPGFSAPRVRTMYELLDRLDPYHPAMPVFGGPDAGAFRDCADIFLFDHYPGRGGGASVAWAMDRARESLPGKPIWFVAQAFRSGGYLPTEEDMHLFWRNALDRGARAVFWYSYGGGGYEWDSVRTDPAHWQAVKRVVSELARVTSPASRFQ